MRIFGLNLIQYACIWFALSAITITSCEQKNNKKITGDLKADNNITTYSSIALDNQNGERSSYLDIEENVLYTILLETQT